MSDEQPRRAGPPGATLAWVAASAGAPVTRVTRLPGATSSVVHAMRVGGRWLVLRRYIHPAWRGAGADLVEREAAGLAAAASAPLVAPRLVAADPAGLHTDAPALLMTRLPGRPVMIGGAAWLGELAGVHALLATWEPDGPLPAFTPWFAAAPQPPPWSEHPKAWAEAIGRVTTELPPSGPRRAIHRDLHPANVLFRHRRVTGVVDWVNACLGPTEADLARCRVNLTVLAGMEAADAFLAATGAVGRRYDRGWDLVDCVGLLPDPTAFAALVALGARIDLAAARRGLDELVVAALASES